MLSSRRVTVLEGWDWALEGKGMQRHANNGQIDQTHAFIVLPPTAEFRADLTATILHNFNLTVTGL
jgi:hypothetical protein